MNTILIEVRRAKASDAAQIAATHDESWRAAYQGVIPGPELDKLINRRGPPWWESAIRKGSRIAILVFGEQVAGYANYGRNRARSLYYDGEVYELYLRPEFQGLGFGGVVRLRTGRRHPKIAVDRAQKIRILVDPSQRWVFRSRRRYGAASGGGNPRGRGSLKTE